MREFFSRWTRQSMVRNASFMFGGQAASFFIQAAYFVLLARLLGADEYGIFAGAFALVSIVAPYTALGSNMLFMRYVPKEPALGSVYWGNSLLITTALSLILAFAFAVFGPYFTHIHSIALFVILTISNCLLNQIVLIAASVYQTFERMHYTATLVLISNLMRLGVLVVMKIVWHHATALEWAIGAMVGTTLAAILAVVIVHREISGIQMDVKLTARRFWEGIGYSFAGGTQAIYNDVDKTLLSHYGLTGQNGPYTLAYRVADFATSPIGAVDTVILPRFFQYGEERMGDVLRLVWKSMRTVVWMGIAVGVGLVIVSPLLPLIVGRDFSNVVIALRWLCCLPLLRGIHRIAGSALTGIGRQNVRTSSQMTVAAINLVLNIWWIPRYGWIAAAWSSVASDGLLAVFNVVIFLLVNSKLQRKYRAAPTAPIDG